MFLLRNIEPVRGKVPRMMYSNTFSTEKEMRDHTQPEDTLKDKEINGSARRLI